MPQLPVEVASSRPGGTVSIPVQPVLRVGSQLVESASVASEAHRPAGRSGRSRPAKQLRFIGGALSGPLGGRKKNGPRGTRPVVPSVRPACSGADHLGWGVVILLVQPVVVGAGTHSFVRPVFLLTACRCSA